MQITAIIKLGAEESSCSMLLNSKNCNNSLLWGRDLKYVIDGQLIEPTGIQIVFPEEFSFFHAWCGKDETNARNYYATNN